jgi:tetratricopeptide (TPR) repeat protein
MQENLFAPTPRAELWRYLGWEALNMDDTDQARKDLLRSIGDHATQVKAYKMLAVVEIGKKFNWLASPEGGARRRALGIDTEEEATAEATRLGLEQYYTWTEAEAPNKVRAYLGAGIAAMKVDAADSLIVNAFKRALEADPEDLEAHAFWGDMLRSHGLTEEAEKHYDWVLARQRWHVRAYLGRACIMGIRGEPEIAHVLVKELREHHTWSVEAQQFLQAWRRGELSDPEDFRTFIIAQ